MKIRAGEVDRFIDRLDPSILAVLLYGPDQGAVSERARRLLGKIVDNPADPFNVVELDGDMLRQAPYRLIEETSAYSLMGGRRVVRLRRAGDAATSIVKELLRSDRSEAVVVVEAGDLAPRSSLRKLFETAKNAAALPCYRDEAGGLATTLRRLLDEAGLQVDRDAMAYLQDRLGSDREVTRREIEKLALYMLTSEAERVGLDDVVTAIGDSSTLGLDDLVYAVLLGDQRRAAARLERLLAEGEAPARLLRTLAGTLMRLLPMRLSMEAGAALDDAMGKARPPLHFRQRVPVSRVLERWRSHQLLDMLGRTVAVERQCKTTGTPDKLVMHHFVHEAAATIARARPQRG